MKKILLGMILVLGLAETASAQITIPNTLVAGTTIRAADLNANFTALGNSSLNRTTGGNITGNVTLDADITFDGVDVSDFLNASGYVFANTVGAVTTPSFSVVGDTNTGLYFPAADEIALALGGTQRLLLNASGLTVFGVNIINASGKIPALTSTYLASLDASTLTGIAEANITDGTVLARVGSAETITGAWTFSTVPTFTTGTIPWAKVSKDTSSLIDIGDLDASYLTGVLSSAVLSGTYSNPLTFSSSLNSFRGTYKSSDNTAGISDAACNTANTMVFKDGLLVSGC